MDENLQVLSFLPLFFQGPPSNIGMHIRDRVTRSDSSFEVVPSSGDISVGMVIPTEMHPR